jgi:hypothetical protein
MENIYLFLFVIADSRYCLEFSPWRTNEAIFCFAGSLVRSFCVPSGGLALPILLSLFSWIDFYHNYCWGNVYLHKQKRNKKARAVSIFMCVDFVHSGKRALVVAKIKGIHWGWIWFWLVFFLRFLATLFFFSRFLFERCCKSNNAEGERSLAKAIDTNAAI